MTQYDKVVQVRNLGAAAPSRTAIMGRGAGTAHPVLVNDTIELYNIELASCLVTTHNGHICAGGKLRERHTQVRMPQGAGESSSESR